MPHNSALPEWVVLIATRSGRRRDRTDRRPCHRRGRGDTLTVAGVPHLALGIDAPEGRQTSQVLVVLTMRMRLAGIPPRSSVGR